MSQAIERALACGIDEPTAKAVCEAYERLARRVGRAFDPSGWSNTVWAAEADRFRRAKSPEAHFTLLLHLNRLREEWEAKADRGARGWRPGVTGERLTKR